MRRVTELLITDLLHMLSRHVGLMQEGAVTSRKDTQQLPRGDFHLFLPYTVCDYGV